MLPRVGGWLIGLIPSGTLPSIISDHGIPPSDVVTLILWKLVTPGFKAKPDAHRMYAQDQVVIHTVRM
jgi:hypothetical protein